MPIHEIERHINGIREKKMKSKKELMDASMKKENFGKALEMFKKEVGKKDPEEEVLGSLATGLIENPETKNKLEEVEEHFIKAFHHKKMGSNVFKDGVRHLYLAMGKVGGEKSFDLLLDKFKKSDKSDEIMASLQGLKHITERNKVSDIKRKRTGEELHKIAITNGAEKYGASLNGSILKISRKMMK